ncbi:fimbrial protein [Vibrio tubiashii]|nr:fimbrial protein [Vibrio tubiashii]
MRVTTTELDISEIGEWPIQFQLLLGLLMLIVLQGVGYWVYIQPKLEALEASKYQELQSRDVVASRAKKVALLPRLHAELAELSQRYDDFSRQLPVEKELASMLASVNQVGLDNDLSFMRLDWGQKQSLDFLYQLPLDIELVGQYHDIGHFAQTVASLPRLINLAEIHWQRTTLESDVTYFRVRAYTYQLKAVVNDED